MRKGNMILGVVLLCFFLQLPVVNFSLAQEKKLPQMQFSHKFPANLDVNGRVLWQSRAYYMMAGLKAGFVNEWQAQLLTFAYEQALLKDAKGGDIIIRSKVSACKDRDDAEFIYVRFLIRVVKKEMVRQYEGLFYNTRANPDLARGFYILDGKWQELKSGSEELSIVSAFARAVWNYHESLIPKKNVPRQRIPHYRRYEVRA